MIQAKIIYERTYPIQSYDEQIDIENGCGLFRNETVEEMKYEEIEEMLFRDIEYVLLPEREQSAIRFIALAKELSEAYLLDIRIKKLKDHINAIYFFNSAGGMGFLKEIIVLADNIDFFTNINGYEIGLSLDYYTHAVYMRGKRIIPNE